MFSWFSGPAIAGMAEDLNGADATFIEPPETPAPVFAVRAFKHALFGTPEPPPTVKRPIIIEPENAQEPAKPAPKRKQDEGAPQESTVAPTPSRPAGILLTPGTGATRRKTVTFGENVVDNEGKKTKSGVPTTGPGKLPCPWTPNGDGATEEKVRTKLTAALYEARDSATKPKPRAKDDADITLDMIEPRSESGRYWKEQYMLYSERSEKEVKKLLTKQQLAKNYAKKKDAEAMELAGKLAEERKRHRAREKALEGQNEELTEKLSKTMAENKRSATEIAALKKQLKLLQQRLEKNGLSKELPAMPLEIEDDCTNLNLPTLEPQSPAAAPKADIIDTILSTHLETPTLRRIRSSPARVPLSRVQRTISPRKPVKSPLRARIDASKENIPPSFQALPPPRSPDPWQLAAVSQEISPGDIDRMACPVGMGGGGYSPKPLRKPRAKAASERITITSRKTNSTTDGQGKRTKERENRELEVPKRVEGFTVTSEEGKASVQPMEKDRDVTSSEQKGSSPTVVDPETYKKLSPQEKRALAMARIQEKRRNGGKAVAATT